MQEPRVADDLAGDLWLALARALPRFEGGRDDLRALTFTIARRRIADHRRQAGRRRTDIAEAPVFASITAAGGPETEVISRLSGQAAAALIAEVLPPEQAEVILLRVLGELSSEQVAAMMGRSPNWVRVNQHRALAKLAAHLGPDSARTVSAASWGEV